MYVDLTPDEGQWFNFRMSSIDPDTGEVVWSDTVYAERVQMRSWKPFFEEQFAKREKVIEWKINPKTRQNEKHSNPKDLTAEEIKQQREDAIDYAIIGLEGWKDKKTRKYIECTRENKIALMSLDFFDRFFVDCQQIIDTTRIEEEQVETKNLSTSQSGDHV